METCKDCLHIDVCELCYNSTNEEYVDVADKCKHFKDRSKFIEIPCKVGEDLYRLKTVNGKTIITTTQLNLNTFWRIVFGGEFGKTVFLTKEEAEQVLNKKQYKGE